MRIRPGALYSVLFSGLNKGLENPTENPNFEIKVLPNWFEDVHLSWTVPEDWGDCLFNVYRSRSEEGPFEKLNTTPIDGTYLADTTTRQWSVVAEDYYIVEAILLDQDRATVRSGIVSWEYKRNRWVDLRANEIQRRFWLILRKFIGGESYVFKNRSYGMRCTRCWDRVNLKVTDDRCPNCYGTGWERGYMPPVKTRFQYEPNPNDRTVTYSGSSEPATMRARTISMPDLEDDDLVFRVADRKFYLIQRVTPTELQTAKVSQIADMVELPKNYVEYQLLKEYKL